MDMVEAGLLTRRRVASPNTKAQVLESQARAEHFEYHNMRVARACAMASAPLSDEHLVQAYETLAMADAVIHQSSQAGEITEALGFLMHAAGTRSLIESAKEQARWHLDERRYRNEKRRSRGIGGWLPCSASLEPPVWPTW